MSTIAYETRPITTYAVVRTETDVVGGEAKTSTEMYGPYASTDLASAVTAALTQRDTLSQTPAAG